MEHWIIYDLASGEELWRGGGSVGSAAQQQFAEGMGMVMVPAQVEAELIRQRILTPGAGQAMTYQRKEAEARAWSIDNDTTTPFLTAEAGAREMTIADLAAEIIELADAWVAIGAAIEGLRMGAKAAVGRAANLGAIVAAGKVDWSVLNG